MKKILIVCCSCALMIAACSQKIDASKVPTAVKAAFSNNFPDTKAKWIKEGENFEAEFTFQQQEMSAVFTPSGSMLETEVEISIAALPASIPVYIKANYPGAPVKEVAKITAANGEISFEAEIKGKDLLFDEKGNFIKEVKQ